MTINSPDSLPDDETQEGAPGAEGKGASSQSDGGIPQGGDGVGIAADAEPNTFEPEEAPDSTEEPGS
ncbi:hypothetical protein [Arthrobacter nitrophenolicus]|uniref:Uncharacterized protein n=2 Tax=Arthrobacter nitrophenolicus TaxID=683150 RepID=A0ACC6TCI7_9MICC|nr:hypothetical protein [Arthrobacter nitrophenolicus]ELT45580.1 hypothetical protein G205_03756 [Arthrobacter nitrophenolicus]